MSLIAMCCHDLEGSGRSELTYRTYECLRKTVDVNKHRVFMIDNGSTDINTHRLLVRAETLFTVIRNPTNLGTAAAINQAWKHRRPGENCIKMDNDVIIHSPDWVEQMEEALSRDPEIGIVGLKRKDLIEHPDRTDFYKSELYHLPHEPGQRWIIGEKVNHVMGTCQMYSAALLEKIGYLYQPRLYGFDDALAAVRCKLAGFKSVFLPHIEIDHIDPGGTAYQTWKEKHSGEQWDEYHQILREYSDGTRSIYYNPYE